MLNNITNIHILIGFGNNFYDKNFIDCHKKIIIIKKNNIYKIYNKFINYDILSFKKQFVFNNKLKYTI